MVDEAVDFFQLVENFRDQRLGFADAHVEHLGGDEFFVQVFLIGEAGSFEHLDIFLDLVEPAAHVFLEVGEVRGGVCDQAADEPARRPDADDKSEGDVGRQGAKNFDRQGTLLLISEQREAKGGESCNAKGQKSSPTMAKRTGDEFLNRLFQRNFGNKN